MSTQACSFVLFILPSFVIKVPVSTVSSIDLYKFIHILLCDRDHRFLFYIADVNFHFN